MPIRLLDSDIELLKVWADQQDMKVAKLVRQLIEHMLREHKIEILQEVNK